MKNLLRVCHNLSVRVTVLIFIAVVCCASFFATPVRAQEECSEAKLKEYGIAMLDCASGTCSYQAGMSVTGTSPFLNGDPLTLEFPSITDQPALGAAMVKFIQDHEPQSPWLNIPDFGNRFTAEAKARNVNPMLIVSIGRQETQLGTAPNSSARYNNSFGNKGANPPGSPETDYLIYESFESSLIGDGSFTEAIHKRISGQHPSYKDVHNMYEYISVHLSGQIIYPDDSSTSYDSTMGQSIDADNVVGYFKNVESWIGEMTGLTIEGTPSPTDNNSACQGNGVVNADGYSFPLAPQKRINYGDLPCNHPAATFNGMATCHHDNSPAYDLLYSGVAGKAVYAITDGTVLYRSHIEGTCWSIQFRSSRDGLNYWYGHVTGVENFITQFPHTVKAGEQIGVVDRHMEDGGDNDCKGSSGASHLHIDRCSIPGHNAGNPPGSPYYCRDWNFMPLLKTVWDGLEPA